MELKDYTGKYTLKQAHSVLFVHRPVKKNVMNNPWEIISYL